MSAILILALLTINYMSKQGLADNKRWEKNYLDAVRISYYIGCSDAGGQDFACKVTAFEHQEQYEKIFKGINEQLEQTSFGHRCLSYLLEIFDAFRS